MKKEITDYANPFDANDEFEKVLGEFTGAKGVIATDSCTHAVELGLRWSMPKMYATIPPHVHHTIPMTLKKLGIEYMFSEDDWENEHRIQGSTVYTSAKHLSKDMFQTENPNQLKILCVSFADDAALAIGHGGAILTNDKKAYNWLKLAAYDGRDRQAIDLSKDSDTTDGYHYGMRPSDALIGLEKLANGEILDLRDRYKDYSNMQEVLLNK